MAFPYKVIVNGSPKPNEQLKAVDLQNLRQAFIDSFLFAQPQFPSDDDDRISEQLSQIARVLGRSAGNEPTIYDNGGGRTSASRSANSLALQVERALTQVLGRAPGRGAEGFVSALNSAFPSGTNGQIMTTPARSAVSLYSPTPEGLTGQLSVEQANLYRQASIMGGDALKVLDSIKPFVPTADLDAVEALKVLIRTQIRSLIDEFGRLDEPRKQRVDSFFSTLLVTESFGRGNNRRIIGGSLFQLGKTARLINRLTDSEGGEGGDSDSDFEDEAVTPVTIDDETQIANFALLINYVETLQTIWQKFDDSSTIVDQVTGNYSERLSRVSVMLPVVADSNVSLMSAMDSIGFTESERRSDAALFTTLVPLPRFDLGQVVISGSFASVQIDVTLPDMTVNDFDEWIDRFTSLEAPTLLSASGQFGLDFVTDQADTLFWTIAAVLAAVTPISTDSTSPQRRNQLRLLGKVLSFERVQQTLSELVFQLDTLADLGVRNGSTLNGFSPV